MTCPVAVTPATVRGLRWHRSSLQLAVYCSTPPLRISALPLTTSIAPGLSFDHPTCTVAPTLSPLMNVAPAPTSFELSTTVPLDTVMAVVLLQRTDSTL